MDGRAVVWTLIELWCRSTCIATLIRLSSLSGLWTISQTSTSVSQVCLLHPFSFKHTADECCTSGVITYATNLNTSALVKDLLVTSTPDHPPRIVLETDAPFMVPSNIYSALSKPSTPSASGASTPVPDSKSGKATPKGTGMANTRLPLSHTAMIPWTAEFVAGLGGEEWAVERVMSAANEGAKAVYGIE